MTSDRSPLDTWQDLAAQWVAKSDLTADMTAAVSEAVVARLAPQAGQRFVDLASGAGDPAFAIAERVGAGGEVLATDGVAKMVDTIRARAAARGMSQVRTLHAAAEDLDLTPRAFDGASCRFGVMFFADPQRGLANMAAAVRPGGRLVVVAWGPPERNPYFALPSSTLDELGAPEGESTKPIFEFEEPGRLEQVARDARWTALRTEAFAFEMVLRDVAPESLLDARLELSRTLLERFETLSMADRDRARRAAAERAAPFVRGRDLAFPSEAVLVTGLA